MARKYVKKISDADAWRELSDAGTRNPSENTMEKFRKRQARTAKKQHGTRWWYSYETTHGFGREVLVLNFNGYGAEYQQRIRIAAFVNGGIMHFRTRRELARIWIQIRADTRNFVKIVRMIDGPPIEGFLEGDPEP